MQNTIAFPGLFDGTLTLDRVAFTLFGQDIMWYGVIIGTGFLLAALYGICRAREFGFDADFVLDLLIVCLPAAILGARLYYVAFRWNYYGAHLSEIFNIRGGGLAIYGGLIGAILAGCLVCKFRKKRILPPLDLASLGFLIGQSIGRWGNFVNCEAFGGATSLPWGMSINGGVPVHPTFLYESLWNALGFLLLHKYSKKRRFDGELFLLYLIWYGFGRMLIEGLRTDSLYIGATGIRVSQLLSAVLFAAALGLWLWLRRTKRYLSCPIFRARGAEAPAADGIPVFAPAEENRTHNDPTADTATNAAAEQKKEESPMKELTLFMLPNCPHCKLAIRFQEELMAEHPEYRDIHITMVNEAKEAALAEQYDYYYVPSYFVGKDKLFEGHAEKSDVEAVFKKVLEQ